MTLAETIISGVGSVSLIALTGWVINTSKLVSTKASFKRLDEYKSRSDEKYVDKNVCEVLNKTLTEDVKEIKTDVKILLRQNGYKG